MDGRTVPPRPFAPRLPRMTASSDTASSDTASSETATNDTAPGRARRSGAPKASASRFGVARTVAAVLGVVVGGYAATVAVARIVDLAQNDVLRVLNPFGSFAGQPAWINLTGLATFALGLLVLLAAVAALVTRSGRLAATLASLALLGVVAWVAHHVLLTVSVTDDGISVLSALSDYVFRLSGSLSVIQNAWPFDALSRIFIGPAFLLVAVLAMIRRAGREPVEHEDDDVAPPAPAPAGTPPPFDPTPVPVMYVLRIEGAEYGPYSLDRLRSFAGEGRIHRESQVRSTDGDFMPAHQVPGLFD